MAWFRNHYRCDECGTKWHDEWSCCCDDECPNCGSGDWSPYESDDLSEVVDETKGTFLLLRSPDTAGHYPDYQIVASFSSKEAAERYVASGELI